MKNKFPVFFIFILISAFFLFNSPEQIAWGGWDYQTVPTLGPSRTPTSITPSVISSPTRTPTRTTTGISSLTATRINTLQSTLMFPTSTLTSTLAVTIVQSGATLTSSPEVTTATETPVIGSLANTNTITAVVSTARTETSIPLVSETKNPISTQKVAQPDPQDQQSPPAWLFPFLGSFLIVTFFILLRLILRKKPKKR